MRKTEKNLKCRSEKRHFLFTVKTKYDKIVMVIVKTEKFFMGFDVFSLYDKRL